MRLKVIAYVSLLIYSLSGFADNDIVTFFANQPWESWVTEREQPATVLATNTQKNTLSPQQPLQLISRQSEQAENFVEKIIVHALSLIGVDYRYGGFHPDTGLDCSGFIRYIFAQALNLNVPHSSVALSRLGIAVDRKALQRGDLVFFNTRGWRASHVGLYLGNNHFIHAPSTGNKIHIAKFNTRYWLNRFNGARRFIDERHPKPQLLKAAPTYKSVARKRQSKTSQQPSVVRNSKRLPT